MVVKYDGHNIEIKKNQLTGKETVCYDGKEMSSKFSIGGATHVFTVDEGNQNIQYEVEINIRWHGMSASTTVRRNGQIIFTDK